MVELPSTDLHGTDLSIKSEEVSKHKVIVHLKTKCGMDFTFEAAGMDSLVALTIPKDLSLTGLCGTCNGKHDDLATKEGEDVSSDNNKFSEISDSYIVSESLDHASR